MNDLYEDKFVELISEIPNVAVQGYDTQRKVIYWNKASELIYGYSQEEALGKKLEDLIIPDFMKQGVVQSITNWYDNDEAIPSGELPLRHKNGHTIHVYSSHVMLKKETNFPEMFCIDIDLTSQKKQEEELREKDTVLAHQSKMASMGEMLDNIAHQWVQPLSLIASSASGIKLQNEFDELTDKFLDDTVNSIMDTTKYLSQTIDDFRGFIRGTHQRKVYNLVDNLRYSLKLLDGTINKNNIEVILSTPINEIKISGYPNELVQVIINLISNAKDALNENNIKERYIFINIKKDENRVILSIKDNAQGINKNIINRIFEPDFTTKDKDKGTGIGLYMSQRLIQESMKGSISVKNSQYNYEGKEYTGACFTIILNIS